MAVNYYGCGMGLGLGWGHSLQGGEVESRGSNKRIQFRGCWGWHDVWKPHGVKGIRVFNEDKKLPILSQKINL